MQTNFTPEQLRDPATAQANKILRTCVHCGFCTATCPTYQVLGDELDSPRGRIYLIKDMLESGRPADSKTVKHVDRCLSCLACTTTCPSGVDYMHLVDHAREHIEATYKRPMGERALRWVLAGVLPFPMRFRIALLGAKIARPFKRWVPDRRIRAMLDMAPKRIPSVSRNDDPQVFRAHGERKIRVALMTGCAQKALNTDINDATIRLLCRLGADVVVAQGAGCCGALTHHMGKTDQARQSARRNLDAWGREIDGEGLDAIVINTSGCGTTVKDYGHLFAREPEEGRASEIAGLARDVSEVIADLGLGDVKNMGVKVAYHAACSLQHGQKIKDIPKNLLKSAGFDVVVPSDSHLCCGSAGTYNLLQPEISKELKDRKISTIEMTSPSVIAAGNIGCMMQIGSGTDIPIVHTVELLDWATGGPRPNAIP